MAMLKILQYPDKRLKTVAKPVEDFGPAFQKQVDDLIETADQAENCGALAATQVDIHLRMTVINPLQEGDETLCLINPTIIEHEGELFEDEACMSVPNFHAKVKRYKKIKLAYQDRHGAQHTLEADGGYLSRCIQHEIDHLNGILFIDHLSPLKRKIYESKLARRKKRA